MDEEDKTLIELNKRIEKLTPSQQGMVEAFIDLYIDKDSNNKKSPLISFSEFLLDLDYQFLFTVLLISIILIFILKMLLG